MDLLSSVPGAFTGPLTTRTASRSLKPMMAAHRSTSFSHLKIDLDPMSIRLGIWLGARREAALALEATWPRPELRNRAERLNMLANHLDP